MRLTPFGRHEALTNNDRSPLNTASWHGRLTDPLDFAALPFRLGDAHPELRRLLFLHIPKTGGTSFNSLLCSSRETLAVPTHRDHAPQALMLMGMHGVALGENDDFIPHYITASNALLARRALRWLLPCTHIRLLELIFLARDERDIGFTLLRHPHEQVRSMLGYRIMLTLSYPDSVISGGLPSALGLTSAEFMHRADASDPGLFRAILNHEAAHHCPLGFSPWLCLPGRPKTCEEMLNSIASHGIHCATASTMASMVRSLTGIGDPDSPPVHLNRTNDIHPSGFDLRIEDEVITPFVEESSMELFRRLQEAGALEVWGEPASTADDYWRCIDRALKGQAASSGFCRPPGEDIDPMPPSASFARFKLFDDLSQKAQERDRLLGSRIWRATAPYRRFRHWLLRFWRRRGNSKQSC